MFRTFIRNASAAIALTFALMLAGSTPAFAHGGGVIRLASNHVAVGGKIALIGQKLDKKSNIRLELRGVLDNYPVGEVLTDTAGKFQMRLVLPPHVPAGVYSLVAIAADGDVAARADLTVGMPTGGAGSGPATAMPGMPGMGQGTQEMPGVHATEEMMSLHRSTSPAEVIVIAVFILASFAGAVLLLRKAAKANHSGGGEEVPRPHT